MNQTIAGRLMASSPLVAKLEAGHTSALVNIRERLSDATMAQSNMNGRLIALLDRLSPVPRNAAMASMAPASERGTLQVIAEQASDILDGLATTDSLIDELERLLG